MRDTAQLGSLAGVMTERWMPRHTRAKLFRSWGSLIGMLPVGGPAIWGNRTWAPDDTAEMRNHNESHGYVFCCCALRIANVQLLMDASASYSALFKT